MDVKQEGRNGSGEDSGAAVKVKGTAVEEQWRRQCSGGSQRSINEGTAAETAVVFVPWPSTPPGPPARRRAFRRGRARGRDDRSRCTQPAAAAPLQLHDAGAAVGCHLPSAVCHGSGCIRLLPRAQQHPVAARSPLGRKKAAPHGKAGFLC